MADIGIDIDGVLADSVTYIHSWLCQQFPQVSTADVLQLHTPEREAYSRYFDRFENQVYQEVPVMPGARRALATLAQYGRIHVVTARPPRVRAATEAWLAANGLPYHSLHLLCGGDKGEAAQRLGVDVFVEDQVHNAHSLLAAGVPVVLMAASYNADFRADGVVHASGWPEAVRRVRSQLWTAANEATAQA